MLYSSVAAQIEIRTWAKGIIDQVLFCTHIRMHENTKLWSSQTVLTMSHKSFQL